MQKEAFQYKHLQDYKRQSEIIDGYEKNVEVIEGKITANCKEIAARKNKIVVDTMDELVGFSDFLKKNNEWTRTVVVRARNPLEESIWASPNGGLAHTGFDILWVRPG